MSFSEHFNVFAISFNKLFLSSTYFIELLPVIASILLTPAATPASDKILNSPISPELRTWVPPHSSLLYSPTETTLTSSWYFSSNNAIAPLSLAFSIVITSVSTLFTCIILSFTIFWTLVISSSVSAEKWVKSNRNLSSFTYDPDWWTWSPKTLFNASCNIWVAVWFLQTSNLLSASTLRVTNSSILSAPLITLTKCTTLPEAFFWQS